MLRKLYPGRLKLALGFMFIIAILFSAFTLLPNKKNINPEEIYSKEEIRLRVVDLDPPAVPKKPALPRQAVEPKQPVNQKQYTNNVTVVDDKVKTDVVSTILPTDAIGIKTIINSIAGPQIVEPVKLETANGGSAPAVKIDPTAPLELDAVDVKPDFPGGIDALLKFLERNLRNPYDLENGEIISVQVRFVVGYDGKLKSFTTIKDGGEAYNKEVIRVLKKMPAWIPGKAKGENVSVYYTVPVKFVMSN